MIYWRCFIELIKLFSFLLVSNFYHFSAMGSKLEQVQDINYPTYYDFSALKKQDGILFVDSCMKEDTQKVASQSLTLVSDKGIFDLVHTANVIAKYEVCFKEEDVVLWGYKNSSGRDFGTPRIAIDTKDVKITWFDRTTMKKKNIAKDEAIYLKKFENILKQHTDNISPDFNSYCDAYTDGTILEINCNKYSVFLDYAVLVIDGKLIFKTVAGNYNLAFVEFYGKLKIKGRDYYLVRAGRYGDEGYYLIDRDTLNVLDKNKKICVRPSIC